MTYSEAVTQARQGKAIRLPTHQKGWKIIAYNAVLFCVNPHTGTTYQFVPSTEDTQRTDWITI